MVGVGQLPHAKCWSTAPPMMMRTAEVASNFIYLQEWGGIVRSDAEDGHSCPVCDSEGSLSARSAADQGDRGGVGVMEGEASWLV